MCVNFIKLIQPNYEIDLDKQYLLQRFFLLASWHSQSQPEYQTRCHIVALTMWLIGMPRISMTDVILNPGCEFQPCNIIVLIATC